MANIKFYQFLNYLFLIGDFKAIKEKWDSYKSDWYIVRNLMDNALFYKKLDLVYFFLDKGVEYPKESLFHYAIKYKDDKLWDYVKNRKDLIDLVKEEAYKENNEWLISKIEERP